MRASRTLALCDADFHYRTICRQPQVREPENHGEMKIPLQNWQQAPIVNVAHRTHLGFAALSELRDPVFLAPAHQRYVRRIEELPAREPGSDCELKTLLRTWQWVVIVTAAYPASQDFVAYQGLFSKHPMEALDNLGALTTRPQNEQALPYLNHVSGALVHQ